eukprot:PRCOL_00002453-RA
MGTGRGRGEARAAAAALGARTAALALALAADVALGDYDASARMAASAPCAGAVGSAAAGAHDVGDRRPGWLGALRASLEGVVSWDAVHLQRAARCGYEYEHSRAFYPGVPRALAAIAKAPGFGAARTAIGEAATMSAISLVMSLLCTVVAAVALHRLTTRLWRDGVLADYSAALFCASPASPFLALGYTEAPFAALSMTGHVAMASGHAGLATLLYALAATTRSNGVLNAGHAWCAALLYSLHSVATRAAPRERAAAVAGACTAAAALSLPVLAVPAWVELDAHRAFCEGASGTVEAVRPWCARWPLTSAYGFIQAQYWGQGLFSFWRPEQLPNFAMAAPALLLALASARWGLGRCTDAWRERGLETLGAGKRLRVLGAPLPLVAPADAQAQAGALAHFVQLGAMAIVAACCMHVQVAARFMCAQPALYWYAASVAMRGGSRAAALWAYFLCFGAVGTVAFVNGLPYV